MSLNADQKNNNGQTPVAPQQVVLIPAANYYQGAGAPSAPQYYLPQTTQFVPLPEAPLNQGGACGRNAGGCQTKGWCRWRGGEGGCCNYVDPRPIGEFSHFLGGLVLGTFVPIVGPILIGAMETSQLAALGSFYGTVDLLFLISFGLFHMGADHHGAYIAAGLFLLLSIILSFVGCCKTRRAMRAYETAVAKDPSIALPVISEEGKRCQYCVSAVLSFFLPIIATIPRVIFSRSLHSRFGSIKGLGWSFLVFGALTGTPVALMGLYLIQVSNVHFRRALVCASTKNTGAGSA